jgi:CRP/FNR family cyclic AMP-dependent transcriptional regulator
VTQADPDPGMSESSDAQGGRSLRVGRAANLLEEDPDLAGDLDPEDLAVAAREARARVIVLERGAWPEPQWSQDVRRGLGLLVLDGMLLRRVGLDGRSGAELIATGDLLRPWQREDAVASVPRRSGWQILQRSRIAILDIEFARRIAPHPDITGQLVARALGRSRRLAVIMAIVHQPRVETRLHMLLWHLADRWGTVRPGGVFVPVHLTHTILAELVAARRPTVSAALGALEQTGAIDRSPGGWMLIGSPPGELGAVTVTL